MEKRFFLINKISDTSLGVTLMSLSPSRRCQHRSFSAVNMDPRTSCCSGPSPLPPLRSGHALAPPSHPEAPGASSFIPCWLLCLFWGYQRPLPATPVHPPNGTLGSRVGFQYLPEIKPAWSHSDCFPAVQVCAGSICFCAVHLPHKLGAFLVFL